MIMVTVSATVDGFQSIPYDTATNQGQSVGTWHSVAGADTDTQAHLNSLWVGYNGDPSRQNNPAIRFESLAISSGGSINTATLRLTAFAAINNVQFYVKHYTDPATPAPSATFLPSQQALGEAITFFNSSGDTNSGVEGDWTPATTTVDIDVKAHLQELVDHPNWSSGSDATFYLQTQVYDDGGGIYYTYDNDGSYIFASIAHPTLLEPQLIYTVTSTPTITNTDGDDSILADQGNVTITGTNLAGATALRIYNGTDSYPQVISSTSATTVQFNAAGNIPVGSGYTIEVTVDTAIATRSLTIEEEVVVIENATAATLLTAVDGHEYVLTATGFPGTWETKSSVGSTVYFTDGIMVGTLETNSYKASIKFGPMYVDNSAVLISADLNLNVLQNHMYNDLRIKAVADPDAADIGAANIISSQTLTTAEISVANSEWANSNDIDYWIQTVNPKNISITAVLQEVIDHANWSSGDYVQIVIDFADLGGLQGHTRLGTNDESGSVPSTLSYVIDDGVAITTISGDDVIELGELGVTIVGRNLGSASNLIISKGAISEAQTISSNTSTNIIFDVTTGAIVPDTGYTVSFDIAAVTYTHTVEFVQGGGVNTGTVSQVSDGYEDTVTNTWHDEYATENVCLVGYSPFLPAELGTAVAKIGPLNVQRGQTLTTGDLTWACDWASFGAFKTLDIRFYAVADPSAADVGSGNLPSAQTLTTAYTEVDTTTWAGADPFSYWVPGAEVIDISAVVQEVVNSANWTNGSYVQIIIRPQNYYAGNAGLSFNSTESGGTLLSFDYVTAAATNIASINATNEIRTGDTSISLLGTDLGSATALTITDGTYTQAQTIDSNTSTEVVFDFTQGSLGYTANATLELTIAGIGYTFSVALLAGAGRSYVNIGTAGTGDNSLTYNESPELSTGDIIDYLAVSANGFGVEVTSAGIPVIQGGSDSDTFTVRAYIASTGTWYDMQTVTFLPASYFVRYEVPLLEYSTTIGTAGISATSDEGEVWALEDDTDNTEGWT